jgi:hypothetical protein
MDAKNLSELLTTQHLLQQEMIVMHATLATLLIAKGIFTEHELQQCRSELERPIKELNRQQTPETLAALDKEFPGFSDLARQVRQ